MKFAINGNRHQEGHFDAINRLVTTLLKRGDDIVMAEPFLNYLTDNLGDPTLKHISSIRNAHRIPDAAFFLRQKLAGVGQCS